jgi:glycosyltransferase involved in cell wall biosynthesis
MSEPLKIILVGSAHPLRGGLATFNERLIREFRLEGNDASIVTFSLQYPSLLFPGKTQYSSEPPPRDVPVEVKVNSINPFNWIKIGREIAKRKPDLLIIKFWMPFMAPCFGTISRIARRNGHTRTICIVDNLIPHEKRPFDLPLIRYWVSSADGFIAMSHAVEDDIRKVLGTPDVPVLFSPHPLYDSFGSPVSRDAALTALGLNPSNRYLLFFGFIRDYKGLDLLLEAMSDERIRSGNLKLIIAGEFYCDPSPYQAIIAKHHLGESVIMINDFIPDSQVVNYFCAADIVVQPYKTATQSGVTQIAYHFGKPMIVTNVGGLPEIVPTEKVGFVVNPVPDEIAHAIHRFYLEDRAQEFGANTALEKPKYAWSAMTRAIRSVAGL